MPGLTRIAVIGTGAFGRLRARAFSRRGLRVAFVSRELDRARAAAAETGGDPARSTVRLEDALGWAEGVFVATPPALHAGAVLAAARAGRAVLVEKPVCASLEEARALAEALGGDRPRVTVAENYRFLRALPALERARDALGPLEAASIVVRRSRAPRGWRVEGALAGGGVLMDVGVHYVHLLRRLLGPLTVEAAREGARGPGGSVELAIAFEGRSAGGARFSVDLAWDAPRKASGLRLVGARGAIRHRIGRRFVLRTTRGGLPFWARFVGARDALGQEALVDDWLAAAARGAPGAVGLEDAIADLEVVFAAYDRARGR